MAVAKKVKADEVITTDITKILGAVTKDIEKDFDISNFDNVDELTFLSTGNPGINYAISGRFDGGFPEGLITELYGENSTGKTLLALQALVETQKKGGVAVLCDSEYAFNGEWYETLGGDATSLIHYEPPYIEKVYEFVDKIVATVRKKDAEIPITIVYDSVAASPSKHEYEGGEHDMGKRAQAHGKGIRKLMGLCKTQDVTFIAINQLRHTFNMYGLDKDTIGGMAWKYATSLRVRMKKGKKIEATTPVGKAVVGIHGSLIVEKNRLRSPFATADFDIFFDQGIDPQSGLFDVLINEGVVTARVNDEGKVSKGWWTYKDDHFQKSKFPEILEKYPELLGGMTGIDAPENIEYLGDDEKEDVERNEIEDGVDSVDADM